VERQEPIDIREARPDEYEAVGELVVGAYRTLGDAGDEFYESQLRDVTSRSVDSQVLVAELRGRIVGTVSFVRGPGSLAEVDDPDAATIRMLGVAPEARGRGIGEALVRECIDRAHAAQRNRVRLDTRTSMMGAQRLYERLGFRRNPAHDWSPASGIELLGYVLDLGSSDGGVESRS
jgi:ribosomal protein S18 acetylase RimI-like enzyme